MSETVIARRYATALLAEAAERGFTERVDEDVALLRESLAGSRELRRFFESPIISRQKKARVIRALFEARLSDPTLRFLLMMVAKHREGIFPHVAEAYQAIRDEELGIVNVSARVARPLEEKEEDELRRSVEALIGKRVRLSARPDASLLGGVIVRVGDRLYDGSISNQLQTLRRRFESGGYRTRG